MDAPHAAAEPSEHATPTLVLGILSIVRVGCFPVGLVLGFIGIARARAGFTQLQSSPQLQGRGLLEAGRICSIIGTALSALTAAMWAFYILVVLVLGLLSIIAEATRS